MLSYLLFAVILALIGTICMDKDYFNFRAYDALGMVCLVIYFIAWLIWAGVGIAHLTFR
jgi:hypothetical protein